MDNCDKTKKEHFKITPAVYLILEKDGKILLSRRFQTGYQDGNYSMIAGHLDGRESMRQATVREAGEEAGILVNPTELEYVLTMHRLSLDQERLDIFFTVKNWRGEIKNTEPEKCDDLSWFFMDNLPGNTIPYVKKAIECYKNGIKYLEFGWENEK
jgi:8-oxo-dGTP diphosphatase